MTEEEIRNRGISEKVRLSITCNFTSRYQDAGSLPED
jgi:hypothetical protein|nr:MAG TPA: hypothetical protein [Caudoviricetes sp.]